MSYLLESDFYNANGESDKILHYWQKKSAADC